MSELILSAAWITLVALVVLLCMVRWRRQTREELERCRQIERRIADLTEHLGTAVFLVRQYANGSMQEIYYNQAAKRLIRYGTAPDQDDISIFLARVHDDDRARIAAAIDESFRSGKPFRESMRLNFPDGQPGWIVAEAWARDDVDDTRIWNGSLVDLSSEHLLNETLSRSLAAKDQFLSIVGRELKQPVEDIRTLIAGFSGAGLAREDLITLREMQNVAGQMQALTENLFDMSSISKRRMTLTPVRTRLNQLLEELTMFGETACDDKGLGFESRLAPGLPSHVKVDETRLRQILMNLLANAVKYTERGEVTLHVESVAEPSARLHAGLASPRRLVGHRLQDGRPDPEVFWLSFVVTDTGPGIDREKRAAIFEPYLVVSSAGRRHTGLGLAVSQRLAALMGGTITVSTEAGVGSRLVLTVPVTIQVGVDGPLPLDDREPLIESRGHILFVDDDRLTRLLMVSMLRFEGYQVDEAADAREALALLDSRSYEALVLDYRMPGMSGGELAARVRQTFDTRKCPRLVALTAGMSDLEEQGAQALFDAILIKPVTIAQLVEAMQRDESPLQASLS